MAKRPDTADAEASPVGSRKSVHAEHGSAMTLYPTYALSGSPSSNASGIGIAIPKTSQR